jgi:hypothetical protein
MLAPMPGCAKERVGTSLKVHIQEGNEEMGVIRNSAIALMLAAGAIAGTAMAQAPASGGSTVIANPHYVTVDMEIDVNASAEATWARIGDYCGIAEWLGFPGLACTMLYGEEGQVGAVRSVGSEVMVGKTPLSYTYAQTPREGRAYNFYHGTLEARPVTATTSKLVYTLMYDNSMVAEDQRETEMQGRRTTFENALNNMKALAEGRELPPQPARGGRGG